ncbi:MAG: hemolysin family protein [Planctomycetota bacterium]
MDRSFLALLTLELLAGDGLALGMMLVGAASAFALGICRHALADFSRTKLLDGLESAAERQRFERLFLHLERTELTTVLLRVLSEVLFVLGLARLIALHATLSPGWSAAATAAGALLYLWPFCRIVPRIFSNRTFAETVARRALPIMHRLGLLLAPLARPILSFERLWEVPVSEHAELTEDIMTAVEEGEREGVIKEDEADMIGSIMELRHRDVSEVMTPRADLVAVDVQTSLPGALQVASESGHTRLPVYEGERDHVVGVFHIKDALPFFNRPAPAMPGLREVMRAPTFVPETKSIRQLLAEFKATKMQMAIVVDEYGGTSGLVTLEDILEEIVGDIADGDSVPTSAIRKIDENIAEVHARVHIDEVNELLGIKLPESDDFDTVAGFLFSAMGKVPKVGEVLVHDNVELKVLSGDERRIHRVLIRVLERKAE